ncbi:MAG TPA: hypothetical protein VFC42_00185 [Methylomirabilota bacterium]|jgi:hypothetical protein|nr:hypothetical protein [Methylomirabilota bacterium]
MKLSELLRANTRPQAFGALTRGDAACAVAQVFEEAFGVRAERVGVRRESQLLRWVLQTYRIEIPTRREWCRKCALPFELPDGLSGYLIHLNDVHVASKAVIIEALEELGL